MHVYSWKSQQTKSINMKMYYETIHGPSNIKKYVYQLYQFLYVHF